MKVLVNWLSSSATATTAVARAVEHAGLWGVGITDSPRAGEMYAMIGTCLAATRTLRVGPCVTNPVTRHTSVHVAGARYATRAGDDRFFFGIGTGDSAVRGVGLRPLPASAMVDCVDAVRDEVGPIPAFVAAAGPRATEAAGRVGGLLAGSGRDLAALRSLAEVAERSAAADRTVDTWVSLRFAVGRDADEIALLERAFLPRALSAARFNLHRAAGVPAEYEPILRERFERYDYRHHGQVGGNPNATLLADRPDIERWALDRYAVIGDVDRCAAALGELDAAGVTGVFLSVRFDDPLPHVAGAARAAALAGIDTDAMIP